MKHELRFQIENISNDSPFLIRAHHLTQFRDILSGYSAKEQAKRLHLATRATKDSYWRNALGHSYKEDVVGVSFQKEAQRNRSIRLVFEKFLKLPDNQTVEVGEAILDGICRASAIGDHCSHSAIVGNNSNPPPNPLGSDEYYFDAFVASLRNLKYPDRPPECVVFKGEIMLTGLKGAVVARRVRTSMRNVKDVLADWKMLT